MPKKLIAKLADHRTLTPRDGEALGNVGRIALALAPRSPYDALGLDVDRLLDQTRLRLLRSPRGSREKAGRLGRADRVRAESTRFYEVQARPACLARALSLR
jgi:hypothetical protein